MTQQGMGISTLASNAEVSERTVQRALSSQGIDAESLARIAGVFGLTPAQLMPGNPTPLDPPKAAKNKRRLPFTAKVEGPDNLFDILSKDSGALRYFLLFHAMDLIRDGAIKLSLERGCVAITAELTTDDIQRLNKAFLSGKLAWLNIQNITIGEHSPEPYNVKLVRKHRLKNRSKTHTVRSVSEDTGVAIGAILKALASLGMMANVNSEIPSKLLKPLRDRLLNVRGHSAEVPS